MGTIQHKYFDQNRKLSCRQFGTEAKQVFSSAVDPDGHCTRFNATVRFRIGFLTRHRLSLRTPTLKRKVYAENGPEIDEYLRRVRLAGLKYGNDLMFNIDETSWKNIQLAGKTIAPIDVESVPVVVHGNPKAAMSAVCTISRSGLKLPPLYILHTQWVSTIAALRQIVSLNRVTWSENGWMDETITLKYLSWPRKSRWPAHGAESWR
jgi:hypothetical protein